MKYLLRLPALCACLCLLQSAAASAQQTAPPQQPQDATQAPAPIVRPKPIILRPKPLPGATGASGSTGSSGTVRPAEAPKPKLRPAAPANGIISIEGAASPKLSTTNKVTAPARQQPAGTAAVPFNRTTIVLDPSHGAVDGGSRITDSLLEKDVDLAFAFRLRSLLTARGFTVQLTRDADAATPPDSGMPFTLDDRAGIANHLHPVACLLIHATGSGKGVHLYSSELTPAAIEPPVMPWLAAQASWVHSSRALQRELGTALTRAEIPLVMSRASIRPLDSLTCPALVLELAPDGSDKDSVNDAGYQQRVANALASALVFWQNQAQPPDRQLPTPPTPAGPAALNPTPLSTAAPSPSTTPGAQP